MVEAAEKKQVFVFESKFPGLQLHRGEKKTQDGDAVIRSLDMVQFSPQAVLELAEDGKTWHPKQVADIKHHDPKGRFTTTDPELAKWMRGHKNHGKTFREITK